MENIDTINRLVYILVRAKEVVSPLNLSLFTRCIVNFDNFSDSNAVNMCRVSRVHNSCRFTQFTFSNKIQYGQMSLYESDSASTSQVDQF